MLISSAGIDDSNKADESNEDYKIINTYDSTRDKLNKKSDLGLFEARDEDYK